MDGNEFEFAGGDGGLRKARAQQVLAAQRGQDVEPEAKFIGFQDSARRGIAIEHLQCLCVASHPVEAAHLEIGSVRACGNRQIGGQPGQQSNPFPAGSEARN